MSIQAANHIAVIVFRAVLRWLPWGLKQMESWGNETKNLPLFLEVWTCGFRGVNLRIEALWLCWKWRAEGVAHSVLVNAQLMEKWSVFDSPASKIALGVSAEQLGGFVPSCVSQHFAIFRSLNFYFWYISLASSVTRSPQLPAVTAPSLHFWALSNPRLLLKSFSLPGFWVQS